MTFRAGVVLGSILLTTPSSGQEDGLNYLQGAALFVGVPALVLFLIAAPIYGPVWWRSLRRRGRAHDDATDRGRAAQPSTQEAPVQDRESRSTGGPDDTDADDQGHPGATEHRQPPPARTGLSDEVEVSTRQPPGNPRGQGGAEVDRGG